MFAVVLTRVSLSTMGRKQKAESICGSHWDVHTEGGARNAYSCLYGK